MFYAAVPPKLLPIAATAGRTTLAQRYQDRADYLRAMARKTSDAETRAELQRMARTFETRAERSPARRPGDGRSPR